MTDDIKVSPLIRQFVDMIARRPLVVFLLGLTLIGCLLPGLGRLTTDFTYRAFFKETDPLLQRYDAFERQFGNDDFVIVALHSPSGIFDIESATLLQEFTEKMWLIPEVIRVDSLSNFNWVHASEDDIVIEPLLPDDVPLTQDILNARKKIALEHETIPDYLISRDAKTALIYAALKPGIGKAQDDFTIATATRKLIAQMQRGDHVIHLAGGSPLNVAFAEAAQHDMQTLMPVVLLLIVALLFGLMRRISGILIPLFVAILAVIGSLSFAGWVGIKITNMTTMLPQILLAISIADSVHLLVTFYNAMARGMGQREAAKYSMVKNFWPTLLTSISTTLAFFSFLTADLVPIADIGLSAGIGALLAWLMTYVLLGPLILMLPIKPRPRPGQQNATKDARIRSFTQWIGRHRTAIIVAFSLACICSIAASTQNTVNSDPFKYFTPDFPIRVANEFIEEHVGGTRGAELVIDSGIDEGIKDPVFLHKVEQLQTWIEQQPQVTRVVSIVDILKQTNRSLHGDDQAYFKLPTDKATIGQELFLYTMGLPRGMDINDRISIKQDALRMTTRWTIPTSTQAVAMVRSIEAKGQTLGLNVITTGKYMIWQSMNRYVVRSFVVSIVGAIIMISLLLIIVFRSLKLGLLALFPNVVPLIIGGAVLWLLGKPIDIGTVLVMSICLGISVDDTIHFLSNYHRLRNQGRTGAEAVYEVLVHTGPALLVTTLILVTAFGTFILATFTPNLYTGVLTAIILSVALLADLTLLPALLLPRISKQKEPVAVD